MHTRAGEPLPPLPPSCAQGSGLSLLDRTQVELGLWQVVSPDEPPPPFPPSCAQGSGLSLLDRTQVALGLMQVVNPDEPLTSLPPVHRAPA